jgi:hypothetical protein
VAAIFTVDEKVKQETSVKTCGSRLYGVMSQKITLQMENTRYYRESLSARFVTIRQE